MQLPAVEEQMPLQRLEFLRHTLPSECASGLKVCQAGLTWGHEEMDDAGVVRVDCYWRCLSRAFGKPGICARARVGSEPLNRGGLNSLWTGNSDIIAKIRIKPW